MIYRLLLTLAAPILIGALVLRVLRRRESWRDLGARLGLRRCDAALWLHGASNGELMAARPLIRALSERFSDSRILVTCNTITARRMVQGWDLPNVCAELAPLDLRWSLRGRAHAASLRAFVLLEADFWPNRQAVLARRGIPALLVGGRMSARSARSWGRFGGLGRAVMGSFAQVWPQSEPARDVLMQLGVADAAMADVLDLKAAYDAGHTPVAKGLERSTTWLAASTHEGEDALVLQAHAIARRTLPGLRLILAPRHPKRGDALADMVRSKGFSLARRSADEPPGGDVYLADTMGEMDLWYASSFACFVAGSVVPKGGHTPFEPLSHGCAILHGPHTETFAGIYADLDTAGGAELIHDADELAHALVALTDQSVAAHRTAQARQVIAQRSAPAQSIAEIVQTLENLAFRDT